MTETKTTLSSTVYDSFFILRDSIEAISCAADLIPCGGGDESLGLLFRRLSERLQGDLAVHLNALVLIQPFYIDEGPKNRTNVI